MSTNLQSVGKGIFYSSPSLMVVTPSEVIVESYGKGRLVFQFCRPGVTDITINSTVQTIGFYVFSFCDSLTNVTIPPSVTSIYKGAFYNCSSLQQIELPQGLTSFSDSVFQFSALTSIVLPNNLLKIGKSAFSDCVHLSNVTLPANLNFIDNSAFQSCISLKNITIPSNVFLLLILVLFQFLFLNRGTLSQTVNFFRLELMSSKVVNHW
jgi:hypothetical protein